MTKASNAYSKNKKWLRDPKGVEGTMILISINVLSLLDNQTDSA